MNKSTSHHLPACNAFTRRDALVISVGALGAAAAGLVAPAHAEDEIESHCEGGHVASAPLRHSKMYSGLERAIIAYQSRRGG